MFYFLLILKCFLKLFIFHTGSQRSVQCCQDFVDRRPEVELRRDAVSGEAVHYQA